MLYIWTERMWNMTNIQQFFELMCRFHRLRVPEQIGLLPRAEHIILEILGNEKGAEMNAAQMARHMHISAPAVSRTMRRLRERGYLIEETDPMDRRITRARITDSGRARLAEDVRRLDTFIARALAHLEPGEAEQFFALFDRFCSGIECELDAWNA